MSVGVSVNVREVAYVAKKTTGEGGGTQGGGSDTPSGDDLDG